MLDLIDSKPSPTLPNGLDVAELAKVRAELLGGGMLPYRWYSDPAIFELERERIFRRTWQFVALTFDIPNAGDVKPINLAGIPLVLTRDRQGKVHALVNICRHRGFDLVRECANKATLTCPYHGWVYELDGRLRGAPRSNLEAGFDKADYPLQSVRLEAFGPFLFVNLDPAAPTLREWMGKSGDAMEESGVDFDNLIHHGDNSYDVQGNWKAYAENTNECYHCPVAHPTIGTLFQVGPDDYGHELLDNGLLTSIPTKEGGFATGMRKWPYLWPNHKMYPFVDKIGAGFHITYWTPVSATRTIVTSRYLFSPETPLEHRERLTDFSKVIVGEDVGLVEGVQRGMNAGMFDRGRYMAGSEYGLQHIGKLTFAALTGDRSVLNED